MGIVIFLKPIISWAFLYGLYVGGFITALISIVRRAEWGLFLMVALIPQPNIWYKLYGLPLGKEHLDILFAAVFIGIFINKNGFKKSDNAIIILFFLVASYLSVWNSSLNFQLPMPITKENQVLVVWKSYFVMIFLYFLTVNAIQGEKHQKQLAMIMVFVVLFVTIRSYRSFTAEVFFSEDSREAGPFWIIGLGSNHYGAFIAYCYSFILGMFLIDKEPRRRLVYAATLLFGLHPLFFTYSRGAYLAIICVLTVYGILKEKRLLVVVVIIILLWQVILPSSVVERIQMTKTPEGSLEASAAARLDLWSASIDMFKQNPKFGSGFNGFSIAHANEHWSDTHNFYLKTLCEQGIIGCVLLLLVLVGALRSGWKLFRRGGTAFQRGLGLGFIGCVIAHIITNIFGDRFSYFEMGAYFWVFWGLVDRGILMARAATKAAQDVEQTACA